MKLSIGSLICCAILCVGQLSGQSRSVIVDARYAAPVRSALSPGQLVTLLARGITAPDSQASQIPLPLELAGVTAVMQEPRLGGYRKQLPILRIDSIPCGSGFAHVCDFKAVTVQVPVDLQVEPPFGAPRVAPTPTITLSENGVEGFASEFVLQHTSVTILNDCYFVIRPANPTCATLVTHADGSLITSSNPGRPGEEVVLYAVGLGLTSPLVAEGKAAPSPSPRTIHEVSVAFGTDGVPPSGESNSMWVRPTWSGLVSGFAGLYQVNLRLPDRLPPMPSSGTVGIIKVTLATSASRDTADVWVQR